MNRVILIFVLLLGDSGCGTQPPSQESRDRQVVQTQQSQYAKGQPIPIYDWSLERDLVIQLYNIRNERVATHSVWRGEMSVIEGDCPSIGYGLPYDTSLTNPLMATTVDEYGNKHTYQGGSLTTIGQAEPNGVFASTNTSATWVMCVGNGGTIAPVYVETKVTVYPYPLEVDYVNNRVKRAGESSVNIMVGKAP